MSRISLPKGIWLLGLILFMASAPQKGAAQNTALMIIDMQAHFSEDENTRDLPGNPEKKEQVLARQRELIRRAKANNLAILVVEYSGCGDTDCTLIKEIGDYKGYKKILKVSDNLFRYKAEAAAIMDYFAANKITDLFIGGANGAACVKDTLVGALDRGLRVWTDPCAIIDFNPSHYEYPFYYKTEKLDLMFNELYENFAQLDSDEKINSVLRNNREGFTPPALPYHRRPRPSCDPTLRSTGTEKK